MLSKKRLFFYFRVDKIKFHHFWPACKNRFGYPWIYLILPAPGKSHSDAHAIIWKITIRFGHVHIKHEQQVLAPDSYVIMGAIQWTQSTEQWVWRCYGLHAAWPTDSIDIHGKVARRHCWRKFMGTDLIPEIGSMRTRVCWIPPLNIEPRLKPTEHLGKSDPDNLLTNITAIGRCFRSLL